MEITQPEADALLEMAKVKTESCVYDYPWEGGNLVVPLHSVDKREKFVLDISRRRIEVSSNKFQTRGRDTVILARLDIDTRPHRNPDGEELNGPHLHLYREGYGDKFAIPIPELFTNPSDCMQTLREFMGYCNIVDAPNVRGGLYT
jgi:hypothetical protein